MGFLCWLVTDAQQTFWAGQFRSTHGADVSYHLVQNAKVPGFGLLFSKGYIIMGCGWVDVFSSGHKY